MCNITVLRIETLCSIVDVSSTLKNTPNMKGIVWIQGKWLPNSERLQIRLAKPSNLSVKRLCSMFWFMDNGAEYKAHTHAFTLRYLVYVSRFILAFCVEISKEYLTCHIVKIMSSFCSYVTFAGVKSATLFPWNNYLHNSQWRMFPVL